MRKIDIEEMTKGFDLCLKWSSNYEFDEYTIEGLEDYETDPQNYKEMEIACTDFIDNLPEHWIKALPDQYSDQRLGHDFALTRNGHGAGFWDRDELKIDINGSLLSDLLTSYAENWEDIFSYIDDNDYVGFDNVAVRNNELF
jgi:hypothetical protein